MSFKALYLINYETSWFQKLFIAANQYAINFLKQFLGNDYTEKNIFWFFFLKKKQKTKLYESKTVLLTSIK